MDKGREKKMYEGHTVIKEVNPKYLEFEGYDNIYKYRKKNADPFAPVEEKYFRITEQYEDMGF